ncbi:glycosyltransferase [Janibacter anophelis]|uniref:glycosyltransferase n=1 Tax=Janibacter anophelis TaxID=319054 RepID=UPI003F81BA8C
MTQQPSATRERTRLGAGEDRPITVASVPGSHVYVRHIAHEGKPSGVRRLEDPDPQAPDRSAQQQWWPPVMLDPAWLADADYDLLHVQFGFDARDPAQLDEALSVARRRGAPIVYTAHDLRNPHHPDSTTHARQLDVLMQHADAVVTLTPGAADEIRRRWARDAIVLPHPHVVDLPTMRAHRNRDARSSGTRGEFRVGVHVKSLRANMDPLALLPVLEETVADLPGGVLQVNGHRDVLSPDGARRDAALADHLEEAARRGLVDLRVHDYLDDASLWDHLGSLDVSVLPYRFGTHSGWLEACRDLGTTVVAPTCGYYAEQGPVLAYEMDEGRFDPESLAAAVRSAYAHGPLPAPTVDERRRQRLEVATAHETLYRRLLS